MPFFLLDLTSNFNYLIPISFFSSVLFSKPLLYEQTFSTQTPFKSSDACWSKAALNIRLISSFLFSLSLCLLFTFQVSVPLEGVQKDDYIHNGTNRHAL